MDPEDILTDSPNVPDVPEIPTIADFETWIALSWVLQFVWILVLAVVIAFLVLGIRKRQRAEKEQVAPILERARRAKAEREAGTAP